MNKASQGRTTITVAHRLSTIKDANRIFVMGDGGLIEAGTHDELLADEEGAYARLVNAQKLREEQDVPVSDDAEALDDDEKVFEAAEKEKAESIRSGDGKPLERVSTSGSRSLASVALSRRNAAHKRVDEDAHYGMVYLFKRMGAINKDGTTVYVIGSLAAIGAFFSIVLVFVTRSIALGDPCSCNIQLTKYCPIYSHRHDLPRFRNW